MAKIFVKQGNAAIDVSPELNELVNKLLDANPLIKAVMQDEVETIYQQAYRQWPVRVIAPRTAEQKREATFFAISRSAGKTRDDAIAITASLDDAGRFIADAEPRISPKSKDSKERLQRGLLISNDEIVAFVRNDAPYAWAIKTGRYTLNDLAFGTRTCNELLWKPIKKAGDTLVNEIARLLTKQAKR